MGCDAARGQLAQVALDDGPADIIVRFRSKSGREFIVPFRSFCVDEKGFRCHWCGKGPLIGGDFDAIDVLRSAYKELCRTTKVGVALGAIALNLDTAEVTVNAAPEKRHGGLFVSEANHILAVCHTAKDPRDPESVKAAAVYSSVFSSGSVETIDSIQSRQRFDRMADDIVKGHEVVHAEEFTDAPFTEAEEEAEE